MWWTVFFLADLTSANRRLKILAAQQEINCWNTIVWCFVKAAFLGDRGWTAVLFGTFSVQESGNFRLAQDIGEHFLSVLGLGDILRTKVFAIGSGAAVDDSPGHQPRESGRRSREAAEQRRRLHRGMTSLLRSSDILCADDLRLHRRLPHAAAPQRIASRYVKEVGKDKVGELQLETPGFPSFR